MDGYRCKYFYRVWSLGKFILMILVFFVLYEGSGFLIGGGG